MYTTTPGLNTTQCKNQTQILFSPFHHITVNLKMVLVNKTDRMGKAQWH